MPIVLIAFACLLSSSPPALAVPASPIAVQIEQPFGQKFNAHIRGDEFQRWVETDDGHAVIENRQNGTWEYAVQGQQGKLGLSGIEVDPSRSPPDIPRNVRPARDIERENQFRELVIKNKLSERMMSSGGLSVSGPDAAPSLQPAYVGGNWAPVPVSGSKKLLVVLVDFADRHLVVTPSTWNDYIFNTTAGAKSLANYYKDNSFGALTVASVAHTQPGSPAGIVKAIISLNHPYNSPAPDSYDTEAAWINAALVQAANYVDFAALDTNHDGVFQDSELVVYFIVAGYEQAESYKTPSIWAHSWGGPGVTAGGVALQSWALNGELNDAGVHEAIGVMTHEMGHSMCGLPDLYDTSYTNSGLGIFSLMAAGSWGKTASEPYPGTTPVGLDAWSRQYLGWSVPRLPSSGDALSFGPALSASNATVKLVNPAVSNTQYFLAENRYPTGWDKGMEVIPVGNWAGGLLILHVDETIGTLNNNDINLYVPGGHQGVMAEEASTVNGSIVLGTSDGAPTHLFYSGNNSHFTDSTNPNSRLYNGTQTFLGLDNISAPGQTMTATMVAPVNIPLSMDGLSSTPASPQLAGATITWDAAASGGSGSYQYQFLRSGPDTAGTYVVMQDWGASKTWAWNTAAAAIGNHYVMAKARNSDGSGTAVYKISPAFTLNGALTVSSIVPAPASPVAAGTNVTWTATATGGSGSYQYQFLRYGPDTAGAYAVMQDWGASKTWAWNTAAAATGNHYVMAKARNSDGSGAVYKISTMFKIYGPVTVSSITPSPASPAVAGTNVTWTATAAGGSGSYQYQFWRYGPDTGGVYVLVRDWGTAKTWSWNTTGAAVGNHYVMFKVKNADGSGAAAYLISAAFKVQSAAPPITITSITPSPLSPVVRGAMVTWAATATGGSGSLKYQFWRYGPDTGGVYVMTQDWGASGSWPWDTSGASLGTHYVMVKVKNSDGTGTVAYKISSGFTVK